MNNTYASPALQRIIAEDAVGQLRRRDGRMAELGSENGEVKLDWVEGVARLLADPSMLEGVETEAREIWQRSIRHIIWAGMGGSVLTVRVLTSMGFCSTSSQETEQATASERITIYPLDSTDPAALNEIMRKIAGMKGMSFPSLAQNQQPDPAFLRALLDDVLMIGVSMGMTSEEPITHLTWFADLLAQAQLTQAEHLMVMTLPGSYLDRFAQERSAPSLPLQPDRGTGTGGRMSAPATRVFLLPVALAFAHMPSSSSRLRAILRRAWELHNLDLASTQPASHPFVRLAAAMSDASHDGVCLLLVDMPPGWTALVPWLEQLMEESLGKGGKGVVVFGDQPVHAQLENTEGARKGPHPYNDDEGGSSKPVHSKGGEDDEWDPLRAPSLLTVHVTTDSNDTLPISQDTPHFLHSQPYLATTDDSEQLAASFLGWQLSMALFGYLHDITFAGQPAVENYKARARVLRMQESPLSVLQGWDAQCTDGILALYGPQGSVSQLQGGTGHDMANSLARALRDTHMVGKLAYLDGTINGEASEAFSVIFRDYLRRIGNEVFGIPVKLRRAPADYHSTEQSEMDGPASLLSLRLLARQHERCMIGQYDDTFLCAQAVSTWQAMLEQGRSCFLLVIDSTFEDAIESLTRLLERVSTILQKA